MAKAITILTNIILNSLKYLKCYINKSIACKAGFLQQHEFNLLYLDEINKPFSKRIDVPNMIFTKQKKGRSYLRSALFLFYFIYPDSASYFAYLPAILWNIYPGNLAIDINVN